MNRIKYIFHLFLIVSFIFVALEIFTLITLDNENKVWAENNPTSQFISPFQQPHTWNVNNQNLTTKKWVTYTVGNITQVQTGAKLASVNGNPAIAYGDISEEAIYFVRAQNSTGSIWNQPILVDDDDERRFGTYLSMEIVNNKPAISYWDGNFGDLLYIQATDANGQNWSSPIVVDDEWRTGSHNSLAIVAGKPAISYAESYDGNLLYVQATDADGKSWGTPQIIDNNGDGYGFSSLEIVNGYPAIAYWDSTNGDLKYIRSVDENGDDWGTPKTVETSGNVGKYASLAVVSGKPSISYYDETNGNLMFIRSNDVNGTNWGSPVVLDSNGDVGDGVSMVILDGKPAISYRSETSNQIKFIQANDAEGTSWTSSVFIDNQEISTTFFEFTSLSNINGLPAISYRHGTNGDLRFAQFQPVYYRYIPFITR